MEWHRWHVNQQSKKNLAYFKATDDQRFGRSIPFAMLLKPSAPQWRKGDEHFVISIRRTWWAGWDDPRSGILPRRKPKASLSEKAKQFLLVNVLKINALLGKFHGRLKRRMTPFISPEYSCNDFASLRHQCLRHLYQRLGVQFSCAQIEWVAWWEPWRDEVTWRKENHAAVLAPLLMDASQGQVGGASWSITYQKCRTAKK